MEIVKALCVILSFVLIFGNVCTVFAEKFTNPIAPPFGADPMISKFGDTYYMAATLPQNDTNKFVGIWKSNDLINWYGPMNVVGGIDADAPMWAPEIYHYDGYYYILVTCNKTEPGSYVLLCRATSPEGPYTRYAELPKVHLDPGIYVDTDGQSYSLNGNSATTLSADWKTQGTDWAVLDPRAHNREGPYIVKNNNRYMLFEATYPKYYQEMVYSDSLTTGNWEWWDKNPFYTGNGIGHGYMTTSPDGSEIWVVGHSNTPFNGGGWNGRALGMDRVSFDADGFPINVKESFLPQDVPSKKVLNANIAKGKPTNTTDYSGSNTPVKATDGDASTYWEAADNTLPKQLDVDAMGEFKIKKFVTTFKSTGAYKYRISGSYDRYNWTVLVDKTSNSESAQTFTDEISDSGYYRHFRLEITGNAGAGTTGVCDFQVINNNQTAELPIYEDIIPTSAEKSVYVDIVPLSQTWKYTNSKPSSDWYKTVFNDAGWNKGLGAFGESFGPVGTAWISNDIWLRKSFALNAYSPEQVNNFVLRMFHTNDAEVYINGVLAFEGAGSSGGYATFDISQKAKDAILLNDNNIIAVHCKQSADDQYIDLGITENTYTYQVFDFRFESEGSSVDTFYNSKTNSPVSVTAIGAPEYIDCEYEYEYSYADYKALDTSNGHVKIDSANNNIDGAWATKNFSVWLRVKPNTSADGTVQTILSRDGSFSIERNGEGNLQMQLGSNEYFRNQIGGDIKLDKDVWYDIGFSYASDSSSGKRIDTLKLYVDGKIVSTIIADNDDEYVDLINTGSYYLGSAANGTQKFSGQYDKMMFYNRILREDEFSSFTLKMPPAAQLDLKFSVDGNGNLVKDGDSFVSVYDAASKAEMPAVSAFGTPNYEEYKDGNYAGAGLSTENGRVNVQRPSDNSVDAWANNDFSAWIRIKPNDTAKGWRTIFNRGSIEGFQFDCAHNNQFAVHVGKIRDKFSGVELENGKWYDLGFSYTTDTSGAKPIYTIKMYVNGELKATHHIQDLINDEVRADGDYHIGYDGADGEDGTGEQKYNATFDRVRFYNTVLSDADFKTLSEQPLEVLEGSNAFKFTKAVTFKNAGERVNVDTSIRNYSHTRKKGFVIFALYNNADGALVNAKSVHVSLDSNEKLDMSEEIETSGVSDYTVKAFVWDDKANNIVPSTLH